MQEISRATQIGRYARHSVIVPGIALAVAVLACSSAPADIIDFEGLATGQIVDSEYSSIGVTIAVNNRNRGPNTSEAFDDIAPGVDIGVVFDTSSPTGGDWDLATPSSGGNLEGVSLGNILIIEENQTDGNGDGIIDGPPDDEGGRPAGTIYLLFDDPISSIGFDLIDIEVAESELGWFAAFFSDGTEIGTVVFSDLAGLVHSMGEIEFGDNTANRIDPFFASDFGESGFDEVQLRLGGSGGIDNIIFEHPVPEPATLSLMAMGLAGAAWRGRRRKS